MQGHARARRCRSPAIAFAAFTAHDLPDGMEPNLEADGHLRPAQLLVARSAPTSAWSRSTTETGGVDVLKYVAVDDCGNQINPMIVEGQVHGGVVQGLAQALFEEAVYDDDGNLLTSHAGRLPGPGGLRRARDHDSTTP